jgi:hypothetical protein
VESKALWPGIALVIAINLWLGVKAGGDGLLQNVDAPNGIVSLELAGNFDRATLIVQSWPRKSPEGISLRPIAVHSLIYDCFFMVLYTTTLALACLIAATVIESSHPKMKQFGLTRLGTALARVQVLVLTLDATEDFAMWRTIRGSPSHFWPILATSCAVPKFILIGLSSAYILFAFVVRMSETNPRTRTAKAN